MTLLPFSLSRILFLAFFYPASDENAITNLRIFPCEWHSKASKLLILSYFELYSAILTTPSK